MASGIWKTRWSDSLREISKMTDWKEIESKYYLHVVNRQPIVLVRGEGTKVWDDEGREYLDFTSGWAVTNIGHANPVLAQAIAEQASTLIQTSNQFYTVPQLKLAELLVENSCLDKVFFANSGAEANEGAIKNARKWGRQNRNGASEIITVSHAFHGRTLNTMAAGDKPIDDFSPVPQGFVNVEFGDIEAIMSATTEKTAAVMMEPVQGEGGVNIPTEEYLCGVRQWCDDNGLLLIFDEVQTGFGRLGTLFGYQVFGVEPDVMTLAKGLGGGVPVGAFMLKDHAIALVPGDHGSTFGGNVLTTAAAYASTKYIIDNDIPAHAAKMGEYMRSALEELKSRHDFITDVRGMGLLNAVEFDREMAAATLTACNARGLLLNFTRPQLIRIMPPLTVSQSEIDEAVERLEAGLVEAAAAT